MTKFLFQLKVKMQSVPGIRQWIFISSAFAFLLLLARIIASHRLSYAFLGWNLFLACIPLLLSNWLSGRRAVVKDKIKVTLVVVLWILFLPNCFYIVTDLFHLQNSKGGYPWFDLILILSFAWNGILFGIISIRQMELLLKETKIASVGLIYLVMWLNAVGVYIGRILRFNSWDVIVKPLPLLDGLFDMVTDPFNYKHAWAMSVCFAFFTTIIYYTIKKLAELFSSGDQWS